QGLTATPAPTYELGVTHGPAGCVPNDPFWGLPKVASLQTLRPQSVDRTPRFIQAAPRQCPGPPQMLVHFLAAAGCDCIFSRFQLHNHSGETLCECVVNIARHSISFFKDR